MKTERSEKARATRGANKDTYANQVIRLGNWTLKRADEYNWAIIRKGKELEPWYYGRLIHALQDLPHKMLSEGQKKTLEDILEQQDAIHKEITDMFNMKFDHFRPTDGEKG